MTIPPNECACNEAKGFFTCPNCDVEKHYLVCETCGEAFDEIGYAREHESRCDVNTSYEVKPESEAI